MKSIWLHNPRFAADKSYSPPFVISLTQSRDRPLDAASHSTGLCSCGEAIQDEEHVLFRCILSDHIRVEHSITVSDMAGLFDLDFFNMHLTLLNYIMINFHRCLINYCYLFGPGVFCTTI